MINFKCFFFSILLFLFVVEINSGELFFRGKLFNDDIENIQSSAGIPDMQYSQRLDHFNSQDTRTWKQRYHVNENYYTRPGKRECRPIFLRLGGEEAVSAGWVTGGFWVEQANLHDALLFQLEHRFYGESKPTNDVSKESLKYLNVKQALQDAVAFIKSMNEQYKLGNKNRWILFGGSYPGNLVAWLRLKHQDLVYGAVSSSAPVEARVDFKDYYRVVVESLRARYDDSCVRNIIEAYKEIDKLSKTKSGKRTLYQKFNLCDNLEYSTDFVNDFSQLNSLLANQIAQVVQKNDLNHTSNETIGNICNILTSKSSGAEPLDRFAHLSLILHYPTDPRCIECRYKPLIDYYKAVRWEDHSNKYGARAWYWQMCNEMGTFQSSSYKPQVFGNKFPVEIFTKRCKEIFGEKYTAPFIEQGINQTNTNYLGKNIVNKVERIVFVQGSIDPWHALGVTKSTNPKSPAFYIIGTSHCADMLSSDPRDLQDLTKTRQLISDEIGTWLIIHK